MWEARDQREYEAQMNSENSEQQENEWRTRFGFTTYDDYLNHYARPIDPEVL
jgi:hypothetical protein